MLSFAEVESFVRRYQCISAKTLITPETQFESDLGITGDDGVELLEAAESTFHVSFDTSEHTWRDVFGLEEDEFLFNGEGVGWPLSIIKRNVVRGFSVGQLHTALVKLQAESSNAPQS